MTHPCVQRALQCDDFSGAVRRTLRLGRRAAIVCAVGCFTAATHAQDDMVSVDAHFVTTTSADAVLRAGDMDNNYVVATPAEGTVLRVDAQRDRWFRVAYPAKSTGYVKAADAKLSADGKAVTIRKTNAVKSKNARFGVRGSWRYIRFEPPIDLSHPFTLIETEQDHNGKVVYLVELPLSARAYIFKGYTRDASSSEIIAHNASLATLGLSYTGDAVVPPVVPSSPIDPARTDTTLTETTPIVVDNIIAITPTTDDTTTSTPIDPTTTESTSTESVTDTINAVSNTSIESTTTTETTIDNTDSTGTVDPTQPTRTRPADPYAKYLPLLSSFDAVHKQDTVSAEFGQLINAYEIAIAELNPLEDDSMRRVLGQRLELLLIRKDLQAIYRLRAQRLSQAKGINHAVEERMELTDTTRKYNIIGRLETSAVYDGRRMPMMYRIQSVGEAYPRTLAYIKPTKAFPLGALVGKVVGVVGETRLSRGINLNVVEPREIEALRSTPTLAMPVPYKAPVIDLLNDDGNTTSRPSNTSPNRTEPIQTRPGHFVHVPDGEG